MTNQENLELALNALKCLFGLPDKFTGEGGDVAVWRLGGSYRAQEAIKALEESLAKQEQGEPVGRCSLFPLRGDESIARHYIEWANGPIAGDLYTTPQQRKPLTDKQKVLQSLLGAALGALRYHTEQTRPIQRTKETIAAIEHELAAHGIRPSDFKE